MRVREFKATRSILIWVSGCLLCVAPALAAAQSAGFCFFLADGSSVPLQWRADKVVVHSPAGVSPAEVNRGVKQHFGDAISLDARPLTADARWFVFDLPTSLSRDVWLTKAAGMKSEKALGRVYPTFIHPHTGLRVTLTDEIIVRLRDGASSQSLARTATLSRLRLVERDACDPQIIRLRIESPQPFETLDLANSLARSGGVRWAEPNFIVEIRRAYTPNDPLFPQQWHLYNTGQGGGVPRADIRAREAWDITLGLPAVTIAIIDDGMNIDHADLQNNVFNNPGEIPANGVDDDHDGYVDDVTGWDFYSNDNSPRPDTINDYHATPCAGMAAAVTHNGRGVAGVAPRCTVLPVRIIGPGDVTISQVAQAIQYAARLADVISISWTSLPNSTVEASLRYAAASGRGGKGCVICAAVGNEYRADGIGYPASLDCALGIGASSFRDVRSIYSNYASGYGVFVLAPSSEDGVWNGVYTIMADGTYGIFSGTSAAAPEAAGVCALVLSAAPNLTRAQVQAALSASADKINPAGAAYNASGYSNSYGYGRVNARKALEQVTPDLVADSLDFSPGAVVRGGRIEFWGVIVNAGRAASGPCWLEFWLSRSPAFATRDLMLCDSVRLPALAPGGQFSLPEVQARVASNVPDGLYTFGVVVDRLNEQTEASELNNVMFQDRHLLTVGNGSTRTDLAVEGFDFSPQRVTAGQVIRFGGRVVNRGTDMSRVVWVEFWVSTDPSGRRLDRLLCDSAAIGPLGPGEAFNLSTLTRTVYDASHALPDGAYRLGIVVDRPNDQPETNESNNRQVLTTQWLFVGNAAGARSWQMYR